MTTGGFEIRHDVSAIVGKIDAVADLAVWEAAEILLGEANRTVPIDEGTLERSGHVRKEDEAAYVIVYDTPYAVVQHEHTEYRHAPGRRAKWLEATGQEQKSALEAHIAATIRKGDA